MLFAAIPAVALALAGANSGYRLAIEQSERDLVMERDMLATALAGRIAAADGMLLGLAGTWPNGWASCGDAPPGAAPDGIELELACAGEHRPVEVPPVEAQPASRSGTGLAQPTSPDNLLNADLRGRLARAAGPQLLVGPSGRIALVGLLQTPGKFLVASIGVPPLPQGLRVWLADTAGRSWPLGQTSGPLASVPHWVPGAVTATALGDGGRVIASRVMLSAQSLLVVARPTAPIERAAVLLALRRLGEVAALLGLSLLAVGFGTKFLVTRPLARLRLAVAAWRGGDPHFEIAGTASMPDELRELAESFRASSAALAAREQELEAAIRRADILAAEVHHRVKNNLQIVSSLLALQAQRITDAQARTEFEAARDRISALATLHRHMYAHHDPEAIDLGAFIEELGAQLFASIGDKPGRRIVLDVAAPALRIASDQAVPLALIITEAVSGALKQGFPPGQGGRITIRVAAEGGRAALAIEDDGVASRPDDQLRALLMRGLARQLGADLSRQENRLALDFPLRPATIRPPPALRPKSPGSDQRPAQPPAPPAPSAPA